MTVRAVAAMVILVLVWAPAWAQTGAVRHVHDPCIIREGDTYYLFATGRGIPIRRSQDLVHWELAGRVFEGLPEWAREAVPGARFP